VLAWLAATMGYVAVTGALWRPLAEMVPLPDRLSPMMGAFGLFAAVVAAFTSVLFVLSALTFWITSRPSRLRTP